MITGLRRRLAQAREDDGFTLVELLVTMLILGVFMSMVTSWFTLVQRTTGVSQSRGNDAATVTAAMETLSQDLRFSIAVQSNKAAFLYTAPQASTTDSTWFYTEEGSYGAPVLVHWYVQTTAGVKQLWRDQFNPVGTVAPRTWPTTTAFHHIMEVSSIIDDNAPALFTYLTTTSAAISTITSPIATPLTATTAPTVAAVDVTLRVKSNAKSDVTTLNQRILFTNINNPIVV